MKLLKQLVADIINSIKKVTFLLFLIRFLFRLYLQMDLVVHQTIETQLF